jgi:hypothetical protein
MKRFALLGLMVLTCCWLASAADIDGRWTAETQRPGGGEVKETLVLKANGNKLTGSAQRFGAPVQISDGVINGNEVSFKLVRPNGATQQYKGSLSAGELKLSMSSSRGGHREMVYKKAGS